MGDGRLSIVMITRNRADEAAGALDRLRLLPEQLPVIVVDNDSSDRTATIIRERHPTVKVIPLDHNRGAAGRTVGVRAATTPYIAFCDDDTGWRAGALTRAADLLDAHPTLAVVAAHVQVGDDARDDPVIAEMAVSPLPRVPGLPGPPVLGFLAGMSVVRRDAYLSVGGFLLRDGVGGEEAWLAADLASAGWNLCYVPDVVAVHHPSPRRDLTRRRRTDVRNALWFAWSRRRPRDVALLVMRLRGQRVGLADVAVGVRDAVPPPAWVRRERRALSPEVEVGLRLLDMAPTAATSG